MGGISQEQVTIEEIDRKRCVRLRGEVRLENNGGFVQVALPLEVHAGPIDARGYTGVRLLVYGNAEEVGGSLPRPSTSSSRMYGAPTAARPDRWTCWVAP